MGRTLSDTVAPPQGRARHADPVPAAHRELLDAIRTELLAQAPLFEDPVAYGAGVLDTLRAVSAILTDEDRKAQRQPVRGLHEGSTR